jgi:hypothetical protein
MTSPPSRRQLHHSHRADQRPRKGLRRTDHSIPWRTPVNGRRCNRRPSNRRGDLVDLEKAEVAKWGRVKDKGTSYI